jgi:alpha-tubulin suppressor-like RCC1 family protein
VGSSHSCALQASGGLRCWGNNTFGQLGDGMNTSQTVSVGVSGLSISGVSAITAGYAHTCALMYVTGAVRCWGSNTYGQLGDGTSTDRLVPTPVSGLASGVIAIAAGDSHTCALLASGGLRCWGRAGNGRLGDGTTTGWILVPTVVIGLSSGVADVVAGFDHTCTLMHNGSMCCWGGNTLGQLGDGTKTARTKPVCNVSGLSSGVAVIAAGTYYSCALLVTGAVRCWGANSYGQVGDGTTTNRLVPTAVNGLASGVIAIAARNYYHTCALLTASGVLHCWGANTGGQLGDGTTTGRLAPTAVVGLPAGVTGIALGESHSCAMLSSGNVRCWGNNKNGQLGVGTTTNLLMPTVKVSGIGIVAVPLPLILV